MKFGQFVSTLLVLFFLCEASTLPAQWKNVSPNLLVSPPYPITESGGGAMTYKDGILWAGYYDLWMSGDSGQTWQKRSPFTGAEEHGWIHDVTFFDAATGVVAVGWATGHDIFLTRDAGVTWRKITPPNFSSRFNTVCFGSSPDIILAGTDTKDLYSTSDGGVNWNTFPLGRAVFCIRRDESGTLHAIVVKTYTTFASLFSSSDDGKNWVQTSGKFDVSAYSFAEDGSDQKTFSIPNDAVLTSQASDTTSEIWTTTNSGGSWMPGTPHRAPYYCGSISSAAGAIFVQTYFGIERSTDQGASWRSIGGPANNSSFSRLLAAIDPNIICAADSNGSLWITTNSGGDSIMASVGILTHTLDAMTSALSIIPNPTSGNISITSTGDLGQCSVAIYDMLGNQKGMNVMTISQNAPASLVLPAANGVYDVKVRLGAKSWDLRVVVDH